MFVILPFEKKFYADYNYAVDFVGHPLLDALPKSFDENDRKIFMGKNKLSDKPIIALLPGSRKQEINAILKVMLKLVKDFPEYQFIIGAAPSVQPDLYHYIVKNKPVKVIYNQMHNLLRFSEAALVTSGTATLETALMEVPQAVCYKGSAFSYYIARSIVKIKYISLVNLIMDRLIVKEFIQHHLNENNLREELISLLYDKNYRNRMLSNYKLLKEKLGGHGASASAANLMVSYLNQKPEQNQ